MDELERQLRDSMQTAVDGWSPTPGDVRRTAPAQSRRRLQVGLALASVLLVAAGGIGIAYGVSGSHGAPKPATLAADSPSPSASPGCPGLQFLSEEQYNAIVGTAPTSCPSPCPSPASTASYQPLTEVGGAPYSSSICLTPDPTCPTPPIAYSTPTNEPFVPPTTCPEGSRTAGPSLEAAGPGLTGAPVTGVPVPATPAAVTPTATSTVSPAVSPSPSAMTISACTKGNFAVSVTTDRQSYLPKQPVTINVSVTSAKTCDTPNDFDIVGGVHQGSATGDVVEGLGFCSTHDGLTPSCAVSNETNKPAVRHWMSGETQTLSDTWNQVVRRGSPTAYADPADYFVVITDASLAGGSRFAITAPDCTASQLALGFAPDKSTYAPGDTATFTGTMTNTGDTACTQTPPDSRDETPAVDSSGTTVWSGCGDRGLGASASCAVPAYALVPNIIAPGASLAMTKKWNLTRDGTGASPTPGPVPAGTYTLTWTPVIDGGGTTSAQTSITVTD